MTGIQPYNYITGNYTDTQYSTGNEDKLPLSLKKIGDFTPFYITIAICTFILGSIIILNIICCCSRYSEYWLDRHTGNRWLVTIWSASPHKQPPLDLTELTIDYEPVYPVQPNPPRPQQHFSGSLSQQPLHASREYLELHKRESEI